MLCEEPPRNGLDVTADEKLGKVSTWLRKINKAIGQMGECFPNVCLNCEKRLARPPSPLIWKWFVLVVLEEINICMRPNVWGKLFSPIPRLCLRGDAS